MSLSPRLLIRAIAAWKAFRTARDSVANAARSAIKMPCWLSIVPRRAIRRPFWSAVFSLDLLAGLNGVDTLFEELLNFKLRD